MTLHDIISLADARFTATTQDTEHLSIICVPSLNQHPISYSSKSYFCQFVDEISRKVEVTCISADGICGNYLFYVDWSELIRHNLEKFRAFYAKNCSTTPCKDEYGFIGQCIGLMAHAMQGGLSADFAKSLLNLAQTLNPVR